MFVAFLVLGLVKINEQVQRILFEDFAWLRAFCWLLRLFVCIFSVEEKYLQAAQRAKRGKNRGTPEYQYMKK
tara:strand:+ start:449 stop:664 length:216 start_codon:yes stop_codon:yes gene_type:complete